ncbi:hypothetical protein GGTG_03400 [Gaeumannomyces tritici R3-111a-1]|uniref:Uncharacterized protein n=1 Tax=Gaeumannomyces tritici (strain R3-111a-1) TaxID=644352 RepID=J3NQ43_GAET3|nr:hypothetical protein GGTG_03400 [Gaeumannomyces tritici R3-111a-1]EJT78299.1 hypothetical protein GGTG_03400 [Gaeumannomyces tritici R3-111a-1]
MDSRTNLGGVAVVLLAALLALYQTGAWPSWPAPANESPMIVGRKNTVLLIFTGPHGLSNVHVATALSLQQRHPQAEVHVASSMHAKARVDRVSRGPRPITFHEIKGFYFVKSLQESNISITTLTHGPGLKRSASLYEMMPRVISPFSVEDHISIYQQVRRLIEQVDPAVVVLDMLFRPAMEAAQDMNRMRVVLSPNALSDLFAREQPYGQVLWRYPALTSGFPFPLPWRKIPENLAILARLAYHVVFAPGLGEKRRRLREAGVLDPLRLRQIRRDDGVPLITQDMEGAMLPLAYLPPNVTAVGPIAVSVAPAAEQDPELAAWLAGGGGGGPAVLVNLGSSVRFSERQARAVAGALAVVLERGPPGTRVIWKFRKLEVAPGEPQYADDVVEGPLRRFINEGRVRLPSWLTVDPTALLESGHVAVSVHHGGANVFNEAVLTGVPHVILPLWGDLYSYATLAEYAGLGIWASKQSAPDWTVEELSAAILKLLSEDDPFTVAARAKAKALSAKAKLRLGRDHAADIIAEIAAKGY